VGQFHDVPGKTHKPRSITKVLTFREFPCVPFVVRLGKLTHYLSVPRIASFMAHRVEYGRYNNFKLMENELMMRLTLGALVAGLALCLSAPVLSSQQSKAGVLSAQDIKRVVPATYFFRGQSAPVQLRNSGGFSTADGKLVLAGFVDTSGYSTDVQAKYQGLFITEVKLSVEGTELAPGQYGFGFSKDGKFLIMDVGANDLFTVSGRADDKMPRPVPLKVVADGDGYRLYSGRKWVGLKPE